MELEQVVLVGEHAVFHVQAQPTGETAQHVEHAAGIFRNFGIDCHDVRLVPSHLAQNSGIRVISPGNVHSVYGGDSAAPGGG